MSFKCLQRAASRRARTHLARQLAAVQLQHQKGPLHRRVKVVGDRQQQVGLLGEVDEPFFGGGGVGSVWGGVDGALVLRSSIDQAKQHSSKSSKAATQPHRAPVGVIGGRHVRSAAGLAALPEGALDEVVEETAVVGGGGHCGWVLLLPLPLRRVVAARCAWWWAC